MQTPRPAELTDAELVVRCRAGDEGAWAELVDRFARYVFAIATQGFRLDAHDAEDVFQDVFARVYERLATLRADDAVRPWIGQTTRNCCLDRLRARAREVAVDGIEQADADEVMTRLEDAVAVRQALATLGEDCREVLDRFFCRDESYRTIGESLGLPPGTVASRISRCLDKLRTAFDGRNRGVRASSDQVSE